VTERYTLADRLRARAGQLGLKPAQIAGKAGINRSFVYDILRSRSVNPGRDHLRKIAEVLKVEPEWLLHGVGEIGGLSPFLEDRDGAFVSIAHAGSRASAKGGANGTEDHDPPGHAYQFRRSWIKHGLKASPSQLRIMRVGGDSMIPTLLAGDTVLVDMTRRTPNPPGIFVLDEGVGLVAKRLEHIPNSDPPAVRVISDNGLYSAYERTADEVNILGRIRWFAREM
jgi:transcriptional regulator with XRE-family HTH domain